MTGCSIPREAVAVVLQIQALSDNGLLPHLKLWATDAPEPAETFLDGEMELSDGYEGSVAKILA